MRSDVDGNARRSSLIAKVALIITTVMADWMLKNRLSVYPLLKERVEIMKALNLHEQVKDFYQNAQY